MTGQVPSPAMTTTVRPVRPDEFLRVGYLTLQAYDAVGTIDGPYRRDLADTAGRVADGAKVLVAVTWDDQVAGSVTYVDQANPHFENRGAGDCGFRMLAVDPAAQGQGTGRLLVQACIDQARSDHNRRLAVYSMIWMRAAHQLYASLGFIRRPDRDVTFPAGIGWAFQRDLIADADRHFDPVGTVGNPPPWYEDAWREQGQAVDRPVC